MQLKKDIKRALRQTIKENFGASEASNPSYSLEVLAQAVADDIEKRYTYNLNQSGDVTTHDIEANGTTYILEWTHSEDRDGYIAITETCDALEEVRACEWFVNKATTPSWCCETHMFDGTGDYPATGAHPEECDFAESDTECSGEHETYDFKETE